MATITPSVCCRHCWRTCDNASIVRAQRQTMFARPRSLPQRVSSSRVRRSTFGTRADMTTGVLEGVAKLALQSQLRTFRAVDVKVNASPSRLLQGALDGAIVRGIAWESPLGLSARLLEVTVGAAEVDIPRTLQSQNIQLINVPQGSGRVRFTAEDFSSFLIHPLMEAASLSAVEGTRFTFDPSSVSLAPPQSLKFSGTWEKDGICYRSELKPGNGSQLVVTCTTDGGAGEAHRVGEHLGRFFSQLTLELDGVVFTFSNIRLVVAAKTGEPVIDLQVAVRAERFPSLSQLKF